LASWAHAADRPYDAVPAGCRSLFARASPAFIGGCATKAFGPAIIEWRRHRSIGARSHRDRVFRRLWLLDRAVRAARVAAGAVAAFGIALVVWARILHATDLFVADHTGGGRPIPA
jgi:hypothetical protein